MCREKSCNDMWICNQGFCPNPDIRNRNCTFSNFLSMNYTFLKFLFQMMLKSALLTPLCFAYPCSKCTNVVVKMQFLAFCQLLSCQKTPFYTNTIHILYAVFFCFYFFHIFQMPFLFNSFKQWSLNCHSVVKLAHFFDWFEFVLYISFHVAYWNCDICHQV